ncbi:MAG: hypothetical protein JNL60_01420 [Bacteroidia bacterium]|nr:hypothetical protein [Bacteroidia bacterium]
MLYLFAAISGLGFLGFSVYTNFIENSEKQILSYSKSVLKTDVAASEYKRSGPNAFQNSYPKKIANPLKKHSTVRQNDPGDFTPGKQETQEAAPVASAPLPSKDVLIWKDTTGKENTLVPEAELKTVSNLKLDDNKKNPEPEIAIPHPTESVTTQEINNKSNEQISESSFAIQPEKISKAESTTVALSTPPSLETKADKTDLDLKGETIAIAETLPSEIPDTITVPVDVVNKRFTEEGIFYEVGASWLYGWKNNNGRDAKGLSPVAGINYMNIISNRFALSFGVQYTQVRNLSASSKTSRESVYKYGEQSAVTTIMPFTLHYLMVPLRVHYFMDHYNSFGLGFNLSYLLNVEAKVSTYEEKPGSTENHKSYKQGGYTEGLSWYDSQLALFYSRKIHRAFALKGEAFFGLTDTKQNDFFGLNYTERNSGIKISLIYYPSNKKKQQ